MLADECIQMGAVCPATVSGSPVTIMFYVENVAKTVDLAVAEGRYRYQTADFTSLLPRHYRRWHYEINWRSPSVFLNRLNRTVQASLWTSCLLRKGVSCMPRYQFSHLFWHSFSGGRLTFVFRLKLFLTKRDKVFFIC
jgi:hypothetical protein